jgi:hypothetical protein
MNKEKCKKCGKKLYKVYFGNDGRYTNVEHKCCVECDELHVFKKEKNKK